MKLYPIKLPLSLSREPLSRSWRDRTWRNTKAWFPRTSWRNPGEFFCHLTPISCNEWPKGHWFIGICTSTRWEAATKATRRDWSNFVCHEIVNLFSYELKWAIYYGDNCCLFIVFNCNKRLEISTFVYFASIFAHHTHQKKINNIDHWSKLALSLILSPPPLSRKLVQTIFWPPIQGALADSRRKC